MFEVSCLGLSYRGFKSLLTGVCFGVKDQPLNFSVSTKIIDQPLIIKFFLREDSSKDRATFLTSAIEDGNVMEVAFYNVNPGSSGMRVPAELVSVEDSALSLMFQIERTGHSDFYRLSYEFFESAPQNWGEQ